MSYFSASSVCGVVAALALATAAKPLPYICYSPFRDGQIPGRDEPTDAQVQEDLAILAPLVKGIRTYTCQGIHGRVPKLAQAAGLEIYLGAGIGKDERNNQNEVNALIALAKAGNPAIKGLIVGNEVLLRGDISKARLLEYIRQVKDANTGIPVTTADNYHSLKTHAADLLPAVDFVLAHVHPYWDRQPADRGAAYVVSSWKQVQAAYPGKTVLIGETGFPTAGLSVGEAVPNEANQLRFTSDLIPLAAKENMTFMLFISFDEQWKTNEGLVGPHWGLWKTNRQEKPAATAIRGMATGVLSWVPSRPGPPTEAWLGSDALGRLHGERGIEGRLSVWRVVRP